MEFCCAESRPDGPGFTVGFKVLRFGDFGFRVKGSREFKVLGFRDFGFRVKGFRVFGLLIKGFRV